jgi:hypothetical protein
MYAELNTPEDRQQAAAPARCRILGQFRPHVIILWQRRDIQSQQLPNLGTLDRGAET